MRQLRVVLAAKICLVKVKLPGQLVYFEFVSVQIPVIISNDDTRHIIGMQHPKFVEVV